ncbi:SPC2 (YML055W) [Zygosaccharomyces parabailii]|uniref:Signal peptidase complex subunit 2 n=1 Tax=Zygosaccharomyces bailii (strain CLIB 213 / ATCC 58445 / CBS 680 / BCRC 21525 / NBRC 1098 / NCYC 1416 / NRRL Y-2227) TaxID=1333698 RepID=A0A8J2TAJ0_ZYGB2|nr:SPC2 (YML055W) [Zygosaccharomyces parabailii]CDF91442.1 ZYBA0S11-02938g1_1 [Zygosaccharomyces bailii CLIB 213]CDH17131.1 related to Signal peptidase complex subunit SPC2 [Zygosaccharomyces bailii ISA1307]SJM86780.1 related to Signal peptidase complex subunit SPC2 [Zygosaccharomyces bailii]
MPKPINVYSTQELRQTLDEALPGVFARYGYKQSFGLIDTKLFIGYASALVAGISFLLDKKFKYEECLPYQVVLVGSYIILSIVYWYFVQYVQKGVTYEGVSKDGNKLSVKTHFENADPLYHVSLLSSDNSEITTALPANKVFTEAGYLQTDLLYEWVGQQLNVLDAKKKQ